MDTDDETETYGYSIIRFHFQGAQEIISYRNKTLEEAQEHCSREDTHGEGWFDGYRYDGR